MQAMKPRSSKGASRGLLVVEIVFSWMKAAVEDVAKKKRQREKIVHYRLMRERLSKHWAKLINWGIRTPEYVRQLEADFEEEARNDNLDYHLDLLPDDDLAWSLRGLNMAYEDHHRRDVHALGKLL